MVNPPPYEKLVGELAGLYSRRINFRHRLVYSVDDKEEIIVVRSMWSHYEFQIKEFEQTYNSGN